MNSKRGSRRRAAGACLATAALAPLLSPAHAAGSTWTFGGSGNWSLASNWIGGVPVAGSDAWVARGDAINRTINYDYGGPSIQLNAVTIVNNGTGSMVFSQAANTLNATSEAIGVLNGRGYWQLSGGTHNVNVLTFGDTSSSRGIGTLSGGTLSVTSNFSFTAGTFTQT